MMLWVSGLPIIVLIVVAMAAAALLQFKILLQ
jgi:hypothetical protein